MFRVPGNVWVFLCVCGGGVCELCDIKTKREREGERAVMCFRFVYKQVNMLAEEREC